MLQELAEKSRIICQICAVFRKNGDYLQKRLYKSGEKDEKNGKKKMPVGTE